MENCSTEVGAQSYKGCWANAMRLCRPNVTCTDRPNGAGRGTRTPLLHQPNSAGARAVMGMGRAGGRNWKEGGLASRHAGQGRGAETVGCIQASVSRPRGPNLGHVAFLALPLHGFLCSRHRTKDMNVGTGQRLPLCPREAPQCTEAALRSVQAQITLDHSNGASVFLGSTRLEKDPLLKGSKEGRLALPSWPPCYGLSKEIWLAAVERQALT